MRNFLLFLSILCALPFVNAKAQCGVSDPAQDLPWLNSLIQSNCFEGTQMYQADYNGQTVFLNDSSALALCCDLAVIVYDCSGSQLCMIGGIGGINTCGMFFWESLSNLQPLYLDITASTTAPSNPMSCDGSVEIISPYSTPTTYIWSSGAVTEDVSNLCTGTYCVTATNILGCSVNNCFVVGDSPLTVTSSVPIDGLVSAVATGGTPPYAYNWFNGSTNPAIYVTSSGTYCVTVTDAVGATASTCQEVTIPNLFVGITGVPPSSSSTCDGFIYTFISGGISPYTYSWANGSSDFAAYDLCAGTYCVTVTDAAGTTAYACQTIIAAESCITLASTYTSTPNGCSGECSGTIELFPTGGLPPYAFAMNGNSANSLTTGLCSGVYSAVVIDSNGCTDTTLITIDPPLTITASTIYTSDPASCDGSIDLVLPIDGSPYTFIWSNGVTTEDINDLCAGTYCVTVTNALGCFAEGCYSVTGIPLSLYLFSVPPSSSGSCNGYIYTSTSGGTAPYAYNWNNGSSESGISDLCAGTYCITVTDAAGTTVSACRTIVAAEDCVTFDVTYTTIPTSCDGTCNGVIDVFPTGGTSPYLITVDGNATTDPATELCSGTHQVIVMDGIGCADTLSVVIDEIAPLFSQCVYPGDADNNGVADNFDILQLGLGIGFTGTPRVDQSIDWYAHSALDWGGLFANGMDHAFGDCNGNGIINEEDTTAVSLNYGFTHGKGDDVSADGIPFYFESQIVPVAEGNDTLYLSLHLGDATTPANGFYGIAFSINYDVTLANFLALQSATDSWIGASDNTLLFSKKLSNYSRTDMCITRTDHNNASGSGAIARAKFVMIENIDGGKGDAVTISSPFSFSNIRYISAVGAISEVAPQDIEVTVTASPATSLPTVKVFPNPAKDYLYVDLAKIDMANVRIFDMAGKVVYIANQITGMQNIPTANWQAGIYSVQINTAEGSQVQKIIVGL